MGAKKTYVISDIHMGTDEPTNWYRSAIHQPYLECILDEIIKNASNVDELIILGDLFDYWTYPPNQKPPTAKEIVDRNPDILGPKGKINDVLNALKGRVYYVRGNHDITTTESDLKEIGDPESPYFVQFPPKQESATGMIADNYNFYLKDGILYTHGHLFTLFNAPDLGGEKIPVGHFVTRAISFYLQHKHGDASKEAGFGVPSMGYGFLDSFLDDPKEFILSAASGNITRDLLDTIQGTVNDKLKDRIDKDSDFEGLQDNTEIILERDFGTITYGEAKKIYKDLWKQWVNDNNKGEDGFPISRGDIFAYKAAMSDYDGSYLGWSSLQLAFENSADLVVMGHTHIPLHGLKGGLADYINCGFECVTIPDEADHNGQMTYGLITTDNGKVQSSSVMAVFKEGNEYKTERITLPAASILGEEADDYSCYVTVKNNSDEEFHLAGCSADHGFFSAIPPAIIPAESEVRFWLQDYPGPAGTEGKVNYFGIRSGRQILLEFECPYIKSEGVLGHFKNMNDVKGNGFDAFYTQSGSMEKGWERKGTIQEKGNPFFVKFVIE